MRLALRIRIRKALSPGGGGGHHSTSGRVPGLGDDRLGLADFLLESGSGRCERGCTLIGPQGVGGTLGAHLCITHRDEKGRIPGIPANGIVASVNGGVTGMAAFDGIMRGRRGSWI